MHRAWVLVAIGLVLAGCTPGHSEETMAAAVSVRDQWASAADAGMTAVFGTFVNAGHHDAQVVSATSPAAGMVELHEVVPDDAGSKTMRPKDGGFTIAAGGSYELAPGGDHLMLMDLKAPLQPGADVTVTVAFADGSTLPVTAQVRDFAGANENYQHAGEHGHG